MRFPNVWESFAGVRLGFRFSTELQTAARTTQPKRGHLNRGGTSAPLDDDLGLLEVRVGFATGKKRLVGKRKGTQLGTQLEWHCRG